MINTDRIIKEFFNLVKFDSESFHERKITDYLIKKLISLGFENIYEDKSYEYMENKNEESAGNIYAILKGNNNYEPKLFCCHTDTVSPGKNKIAILHNNGMITSDKTTVLGSDDISGIVSILEALNVIQENNLPHGDIELIFSVCEEPYCKGIKHFDFSKIKSKYGYVFDLSGKAGNIAVSAPSIISINIEIFGKSAHAGFCPEQGVNAFSIMANAMSQINTGKINDDTTVNFGKIYGGNMNNIVPDYVFLSGEIRSLDHSVCMKICQSIIDIFKSESDKLGGKIEVKVTEEIHAYSINPNDQIVTNYNKIVSECGFDVPEIINTKGGSDANVLNANNIKTIVIANAMNDVHSVNEYTTVNELKKSATIALALMINDI